MEKLKKDGIQLPGLSDYLKDWKMGANCICGQPRNPTDIYCLKCRYLMNFGRWRWTKQGVKEVQYTRKWVYERSKVERSEQDAIENSWYYTVLRKNAMKKNTDAELQIKETERRRSHSGIDPVSVTGLSEKLTAFLKRKPKAEVAEVRKGKRPRFNPLEKLG